MRKTHKKIVGFFGLVLVVAMTFLAASLPSAETSALSSMTDRITVHVTADVPTVALTQPEQGAVITDTNQVLVFEYERARAARLVIINQETGEETVLDTYDLGFGSGTQTYTLNFKDTGIGYGDFILRVEVEGDGGATDEDSISFSHYPITAEVVTDGEDDKGAIYGDPELVLDYDPYDPTGEGDGEVAEIKINIYDKDGNLIKEISPITVTPPTTQVVIPFEENKVPAGDYKIEINAYDKDGNELYKSYTTYTIYEPVPVPNTGGLFNNLNISQTDYLITGVIVFMLTGIFGVVFIARRQRKSNKRRH